jgi:hypothetical protein
MLISYTFQQFFFLKYVDAAIALFVVKIMIDLQKKKNNFTLDQTNFAISEVLMNYQEYQGLSKKFKL